MNSSITKLVAALSMMLLLLTGTAAAHSGGTSVIMVNGQRAANSGSADIAPATYYTGQPVTFSVDATAFPAGTKFRWQWLSETVGAQEGASLTRQFKEPGPYQAALETAKPGKDWQRQETLRWTVVDKPGFDVSKYGPMMAIVIGLLLVGLIVFRFIKRRSGPLS
jgi:hypothetical protein